MDGHYVHRWLTCLAGWLGARSTDSRQTTQLYSRGFASWLAGPEISPCFSRPSPFWGPHPSALIRIAWCNLHHIVASFPLPSRHLVRLRMSGTPACPPVTQQHPPSPMSVPRAALEFWVDRQGPRECRARGYDAFCPGCQGGKERGGGKEVCETAMPIPL